MEPNYFRTVLMSSLQDKFNTIKAEVIAWGGGPTNAHGLHKVLEQIFGNYLSNGQEIWNYGTMSPNLVCTFRFNKNSR